MSNSNNTVILLGQKKEILMTQIVLTATTWGDIKNAVFMRKQGITPIQFCKSVEYGPTEMPLFSDWNGVLFGLESVNGRGCSVYEDKNPGMKCSNLAWVTNSKAEEKAKYELLSEMVRIPEGLRYDYDSNCEFNRAGRDYRELKSNPIAIRETESDNE